MEGIGGSPTTRSEVTALAIPERFNMAWYFLDRNVEEGRGDRRCLLWRDEAFTYRDVQARANRCGQAPLGYCAFRTFSSANRLAE